MTPERPVPTAPEDSCQASHDDWGGNTPSGNMNICATKFASVLAEHRINLANMSVIDLGCLFGGYVVALTQAGALCAGLDPDSHALQVAQSFARQNKCHRAFLSGDLNDPALWQRVGESQYDLVLLRDVIEHLPQPAHALANVCRC